MLPTDEQRAHHRRQQGKLRDILQIAPPGADDDTYQDFFYICPAHLKDRGFCTPLVDQAAVEAKKKKALDDEVARVKKEYEEKQKKKKEAKEKDASKDKDKDKDKEKDKKEADDTKEEDKKEDDDKAETNKVSSRRR